MTAVDARPTSDRLAALAALFALTVRQHTHGRRLLVVGVLYLLPCALALLLRNLGSPAAADELEFALILNLLPHGLAPLTALLYAAGIVADEVEEQTLTYLLLRSVPRWQLYLTKFAATLCVSAGLVAAGTLAMYLAIYAGSAEFADALPRAATGAGVMALAQVGYCALFGFLGLYTRRALVAGIAYIIAVEGVMANQDFAGRAVAVVYYVRTLALRWLDFPPTQLREHQRDWGMSDLAKLPTAGEGVGVLLGLGLVVAVLSAFWFARSEFRVKTPGGD